MLHNATAQSALGSGTSRYMVGLRLQPEHPPLRINHNGAARGPLSMDVARRKAKVTQPPNGREVHPS